MNLTGKRKIKVGFADQYPGFVAERSLYYKLLAETYEVELSAKPDYLFCSLFGHDHFRSGDCIKICTIGEGLVADFNLYDYAVGFDELAFGDRYLRVPLWALYPEAQDLPDVNPLTDEQLLNRGFCSFVASNATTVDRIRLKFFEALSKRKKVASGGRALNNVGGPVADKLAFCSGYKFNIAFENVRSPGYVTEKIMQAFAANTVPIYFGADEADLDFNPEAFVRVRGERDFDRAIERILALDADDAAYLGLCRLPRVRRSAASYREALGGFLRRIVDMPLDDARRLVGNGYQAAYRNRLAQAIRLRDSLGALARWPRKILAGLGK